MTLPCDANLNDTPARGPLTAADFDNLQSKETAMLIGQDTEFQDTMAMPRRQPMPFEPDWYARHTAECGDHTANDSEFGSIEGLVKGRVYVIAPWAVLALLALAAMFWPF